VDRTITPLARPDGPADTRDYGHSLAASLFTGDDRTGDLSVRSVT
jgi:hypothetical protein